MDLVYTHKVQPYDHQLDTWLKTRDEVEWALFMEMRTGKTKIVIDTAAWQYLHGRIQGVIVMAKKGEYSNWPLIELPIHMPDQVEWSSCLFQSYQLMTKAGRAWYAEWLKKPGLKWLVLNKESLGSRYADEAVELFMEACPQFMSVGDESTWAKHPKGKMSKAAYLIAEEAVMRRILTGTSISESPLDIWGQVMLLGKGATKRLLGHSSFFAFRNEYAVFEIKHFGPRSFKTIVGYKNQEKLKRIISKFSTQISRDDMKHLNLPPKIYKKHIVPLTDEQQKHYDEIVHEAVTSFGDGEIVEATTALAVLTKLHQIVCGQLRLEDGTYRSIENNRMSATVELLEDYHGKAIIWANYRQSIADLTVKLKEAFGDESTAAYYGGVPQEERDEIIHRFQGGVKVISGHRMTGNAVEKQIDPDPNFRFIVANQVSLGFGRTLTAASLEIYYSNAFQLELRLQSEDRPVGPGNQIYVIDLVSPGTVDERLFTILKSKKELSKVLVRSTLREWVT